MSFLEFSFWAFPRHIKTRMLGSPTDVWSHNSPPFEAQRPHWHSFSFPIDVGPPNPPPFGMQPHRWHIVRSPTDVGSHNPPSLPPPPYIDWTRERVSVDAGTRSLLQSIWDSLIHLLRDPASFLAHYSLSNWCGISQPPLRLAFSLTLVLFSNRCGTP